MSKMFEQALIDAKALKEAALKNAEAEIVEKYAPEVKKVMENILEAEDEELEGAISVDVDTSAALEDPVAMDLPPAYAGGENACPCPDDEKMVTVDLVGLEAIADAEPVPPSSEQAPTEELADLLNSTEEDDELGIQEDALASVIAELLGEKETVEEVSLEEGYRDLPDQPRGVKSDLEHQPGVPSEDEEKQMNEYDDHEEEDDRHKDAAKDDWDHIVKLAKDAHEEHEDREHADDEEESDHDRDASEDDWEHIHKLAKDAHMDREDRYDESIDLKKIAHQTTKLLEALKALRGQNKSFRADNKKLLSVLREQKSNTQKLATTLENLSLQNAKLLYTNEVLKTASLNERQKQIAVEALHETKSVEHAKTVFETLQSTVVSTKRHGRPESLSEVVSNNTSMKMPRRKEQKINNPHEQRWKLLAGIK